MAEIRIRNATNKTFHFATAVDRLPRVVAPGESLIVVIDDDEFDKAIAWAERYGVQKHVEGLVGVSYEVVSPPEKKESQ